MISWDGGALYGFLDPMSYLVACDSAFVGIVTLVALIPVPGQVMKYVGVVRNAQMQVTDGRIQTVTESEFNPSCGFSLSDDLSYSHECTAHGKTLWLGEQVTR